MSDPTPPPGGGDQYPPAGGYPPPQPPPAAPPPSGYPPPQQGYPPPQSYPPPQPGPGGYPPAYQQPYGQPGYGGGGYGGPSNQVTLMNGTTVTIADGGKRAIGRIIDAVIVGVVGAIIYFIALAAVFGDAETTFNETTGEFETTGVEGLGLLFFIVALLIILTILYEVAFVAVKGQTPGKMIVGTKIVNESSGDVIGWGPSFLRWLLPGFIGNLVCGLGWLIYFTPFLDKSGRMQGWHDKWAKDVVITTK